MYSNENILLCPKLSILFHFLVLKSCFFGFLVMQSKKCEGYAIQKTIQELDLTFSRYNFHVIVIFTNMNRKC